jgi:formylglycine-generating enzyme required for sulfatase activity
MKARQACGHEATMMKRHAGFAAFVALLATAGACAQSIIVGVDPAEDSGSSTSSTTSSTSSTSGGYTSPITGPRAGMVAVQSPGGITYYIDRTEVSQAEYDLFLQSNPAIDPSSPTCGWKTTHMPGSEPSDANQAESAPSECHPTNTLYDPTNHGDDPVVCVDWCDAAAYCAWAGKRLCGRIGGGPAPEAEFANAGADAWFNACSNGGTTVFPYGNTYTSGACAESAVAPVGTTAGCHGTTTPFDGIFDMSGNVAEWEDSCGPYVFGADGGVASDRCLIRGGSAGDYPDPMALTQVLSCAGQDVGDPRNMARPGTGIRCCAD